MLAFFFKDKVSIGAWIYLWAFYFVPLTYISVFVLVPYFLDDCSFVVDPEVRKAVCVFSLLWRFLTVGGVGWVACQGFLVREARVSVPIGGAGFLLSGVQ